MSKIIQLTDADGKVFPKADYQTAALTALNGWTLDTAYGNKAEKTGNTAHVRFTIKGGTFPSSNGYVNLLSVPEGYRPNSAMDFIVIDNVTGIDFAQAQLLSTGQLRVWYNTSSGMHNNIRGSVTFIING